MSYLSLNGIRKEFGNFVAVDDFSLEIKEGEFVSLLGPSGCGKTTLLQMIGGFLEPTKGSIYIGGKDITNVKANKRDFGIVFQTYALFPHMNVFSNISFGLETRNYSKESIKKEVDYALDLVKLSHLKHRYPSEISGGQRQRVAIARALVFKPSLLLLDEPLSNLDEKLREDMQLELRQIQQTIGTTTLLVTHNQEEAMSLSDRVVVMNSGRIEQIDEPQILYNKPSSYFTLNFLGKCNEIVGGVKKSDQGLVLSVQDLEFPCPVKTNKQTIMFYVRPEKIKINIGKEAGVSAVVKSKLFLGVYIIYVMQVDKREDFLVYTQEKFRNVGIGEKVSLSWESSDIIHFKGD